MTPSLPPKEPTYKGPEMKGDSSRLTKQKTPEMILAEEQIEVDKIKQARRDYLKQIALIEEENKNLRSKKREKMMILMEKLKDKYIKLIERKETIKQLRSIKKDKSDYDTFHLVDLGGGAYLNNREI